MYNAVAHNKRNTVLIFIVFFIIIGGGLAWLANYVYGGWSLSVMVLVIVAIYMVIQYFSAGRVAISVSGGKEVSRENNSELIGMIQALSVNYGIPEPRIFIVDDPSPNAFATGRNPKNAMIAVTTGLLEKLDRREVMAVLAHEMSHVKNYDILVSVVVFGLVAAIGMIGDFVWRLSFTRGSRDSGPVMMVFGLVGLILAPIVAALVRLALSRQREYLADASSVLTTRDFNGLILALERIRDTGGPLIRQNTSTEYLWFSSTLKEGSIFQRLFSTHPPINKRIERLRELNSEKASKM